MTSARTEGECSINPIVLHVWIWRIFQRVALLDLGELKDERDDNSPVVSSRTLSSKFAANLLHTLLAINIQFRNNICNSFLS